MKKFEAIQLICSYKKYEENIIKVYQTRSCCLEAGVDQVILKSRVPFKGIDLPKKKRGREVLTLLIPSLNRSKSGHLLKDMTINCNCNIYLAIRQTDRWTMNVISIKHLKVGV